MCQFLFAFYISFANDRSAFDCPAGDTLFSGSSFALLRSSCRPPMHDAPTTGVTAGLAAPILAGRIGKDIAAGRPEVQTTIEALAVSATKYTAAESGRGCAKNLERGCCT
jgi:hypothetical protein